MMSTFTQWVKDQENREDSIGYFARYWGQVSPGKISSMPSVLKHLDGIEEGYRQCPDGMEVPAWQKAQAAIAAAKAGYGLAVSEYNGVRKAAEILADDARAARKGKQEPVMIQPELTLAAPETRTQPAADPDKAVRADPGAKYTGWPQERFNRLEEKVDEAVALMRANYALLAQIRDSLTGPPAGIDWVHLAQLADYQAAP